MKKIKKINDHRRLSQAGCGLTINKIPFKTVQQKAIKDYNEQLFKTGNKNKSKATTKKDRSFLDRISVNYIRHNLTNYDAKINKLKTSRIFEDAYTVINIKIYRLIGETYLNLKEECDRQMESKK